MNVQVTYRRIGICVNRLPACTLPLTGAGVVDRIITDRACFDLDKSSATLTLTELAPGETVRTITGVPFRGSQDSYFRSAFTRKSNCPREPAENSG